MSLDLPRHVKKPGQWKRVENQAELEAALADGWVVRLPSPGDDPPAERAADGAPNDDELVEPVAADRPAEPPAPAADPPKPRGRRKKSDA